MFNKVEKTNGDATGEKKHQRSIATRRKDKRNKKTCAQKRKRKTGQKEQSENVEKVDEKRR